MRRTLVTVTTTVLFLSGTILAQEQAAAGGNDASAEAIFENIIQTLPHQARSQVDSAAVPSKTPRGENRIQSEVDRGAIEQSRARSEALEKLPESVQKRVEQAIHKMEQTSTERAVQFKEHRQRQKGK